MVEILPKMQSHETNTKLEVQNIPDIPKSREIFTGDINQAVITVQQITGSEITPEWWGEKVGNHGATEDILDRFDAAFEEYVHEQMGFVPREANEKTNEEIISEANDELAKFDEKFGDDPGSAPLKAEFIDALEDHLKEKYFPDDESHKIAFEKSKFDQIFEKYPGSEQKIAFSESGIEVVACGRELSENEAKVISGAIQKIAEKIGEPGAERLFGDVKLYAGEELIEGGGLALPRSKAVLVDIKKIGTTISQMEDMLSKTGEYRTGDQSNLVENPAEHEALELAIVHEFGHILEHKVHGDVDKGFADLDQNEAPTEYGSKSAREDYAESFMYYIYDGDLSEGRKRIIEKDAQ